MLPAGDVAARALRARVFKGRGGGTADAAGGAGDDGGFALQREFWVHGFQNNYGRCTELAAAQVGFFDALVLLEERARTGGGDAAGLQHVTAAPRFQNITTVLLRHAEPGCGRGP